MCGLERLRVGNKKRSRWRLGSSREPEECLATIIVHGRTEDMRACEGSGMNRAGGAGKASLDEGVLGNLGLRPARQRRSAVSADARAVRRVQDGESDAP